MNKFLLLIASSLLLFAAVGCSNDNGGEKPDTPAVPPQLGELAPISLSHEELVSEKIIPVVYSNKIKITTVGHLSITSQLSAADKSRTKIMLYIVPNSDDTKGYLESSVSINYDETCIGTFKVYQARRRYSTMPVNWSKAVGKLSNLPKDGLEATKYVYNLEKTTNGADSYKNYPAFAWCIDMNYDPENNMEWYLPVYGEKAYEDIYTSDWNSHHNFWSSSLNTQGSAVTILKWANSIQQSTYAARLSESHYVAAARAVK